MTKPMRQDVVVRILGENFFSGTLNNAVNDLKKQSKFMSGYFTNFQKHFQGLTQSAKELMKNGKNGVATLVDPVLQQNLKTADKNFKQAERAFKIYQDRKIDSLNKYKSAISRINKDIEKNQRIQNKLLVTPLQPYTNFKIRENGKYVSKKLQDLIAPKLKDSKYYNNIQSLLAGNKPEKPVSGFWKTVEGILQLPTMKEAKALAKGVGESNPKYNTLIGLSSSKTRQATIAKLVQQDKDLQTKLTNDSRFTLYSDLKEFEKGVVPLTQERKEAVQNWLTQHGFIREKSWLYYKGKLNEGTLNKELRETQFLGANLKQLKDNYIKTKQEFGLAQQAVKNNSQQITDKDIIQGQRDFAKKLIDFASPTSGNYFGTLRQAILNTNAPNRLRLINEMKAKSQEYTGYATGVMRMFGLDPKMWAWSSLNKDKVSFEKHLVDKITDKDDRKLLRSLFNTITKNVVDTSNGFKEEVIKTLEGKEIDKRRKILKAQSKKALAEAKKIYGTEAYKTLAQGNRVEAKAFKPIARLRDVLANQTKLYAGELTKMGVKNISPLMSTENLNSNIALFQGTNNLSSAETKRLNSLHRHFSNVNTAYRNFNSVSDVQLKRGSDKITQEKAQQKQLQKNRLDDINQTNMSLYALSHGLKAVEVPLQQAYDYGRGSIDEYVNFQSAMVGVAKLLPTLRDKDTLLVNKNFEDFRQGVLKLTETLPMSGVELAMASESASRLGVTDPNQIRKVVETGTKLGVAFGMSPDDVTKQVVKIANAKGIDLNKSDSLDKVMEFADAINYLDDHTAASGREIINFTKKAVQTAEGVKMDTKDVSAFGATLVSLGISADSANTGFKNLMTVLQTGPRNQKKGTEYLEKSGYSVKELTTLFKKNPTETAVAFIKRLNKLRNAPAGSDAAAIVRFAFGQMSSQAIMALVNNPEVLEKYLKMAKENSKGWTEKEFQARQKNDPAVRFKLLDNKLKALQIDLGEVLMPIADDFIKTIKDFSNTVQPFIKNHPEFARAGANVGMGMLGLTKLASFGADTAIIVNNLRNFEAIDKMITKSGGWLAVTGKLGFVAAAAIGAPLLYSYVEKEIDKKNAQIDTREEGVKGTIAEKKLRTTTEHGSAFQEQKLLKLKASLNKQGFDFVRGEDGKFKLITDKGSEVNFRMGASGLGAFFTGQKNTRYLESSKGTFVESTNPELFGAIDEAERIFYSLESKRRREGIAPRIEGIKNIDSSNVKAYNELRNKQIDKQSERAQAEIDLKVITDELDKANKDLDLEKIGKYQQKLDQATNKLKKIKESQKYLYELLEYTDLSKTNSLQDNINKKDNINKAKNKEIQDGFKFAQNILNNATQGSAVNAINELTPKKKKWEGTKDSLSYWMSDKPKQDGYTQQQIDEGRKRYKIANDNLYNVGIRLGAVSSNLTPKDSMQILGLDTTLEEDSIFGKNRQAILDSVNQKIVVYNDTVGKTSLNTKNLYGANKEVDTSLSTIQTTSSTTFDTFNKSLELTSSTIVGSLLPSLNSIKDTIAQINSMTISPKVQMPSIPNIPGTSLSYNSFLEPSSLLRRFTNT